MKVSIIITCYNLENYISRAIHSCLDQTLDEEKYEIIVVDDCSTDNSWNIIQNFGSLGGRIKSIKHEKNKGVGPTTNTALNIASGEYVIKVDGDDFINKNMIFLMSELLDNNEDLGFIYGDHTIVNNRNERTYSINTLDKLLDNGAGVMFRKKYIDILGGYSDEYKTRDDYYMISRYIKNFNGYHLRLPYYRYYQREGSLSRQTNEREIEKNRIDERNR